MSIRPLSSPPSPSPPSPPAPPAEGSTATLSPAASSSSSSSSSSAASSSAGSSSAGSAPPAAPAATDTFDETPAPKRLDGTPTVGVGERGGLPAILLQTGRARVVHGDDPGDFYCEHAFFTSQQTAELPSSSVLKNAHGERLVGFLHVPRDPHTDRADAVADQGARHDGARDVVGAALRGYVDAGASRVLLTGYEQWGSVQNNPTGDFVSHPQNIDAAMARGFGRALMTRHGTRVGGDAHSDVWRYRVRDAASGRDREVLIEARRLPVSDDAINGSPRSLQTAIATFAPHGVINMGVHSGADFIAEHHADDGGINVVDGKQVHDDACGPRLNLPDNFALPRAIQRGGGARSAVDVRAGRRAGEV